MEYTNLEKLYADHVELGKRKIESVPASIRVRVQKLLDERAEERKLEERELNLIDNIIDII